MWLNDKPIGQLAHLMLCSPVHRGYRIDDIERLFFRPMQLGQARVWRRKGADGEPAMVGVLTWAWLSPEVETRYLKEGSLKEMSDWTSGKGSDTGQLWFIDLIAPFGDFPAIAKEIPALFPNDQTAKRLRVRNKRRRPTIWTLKKPLNSKSSAAATPFMAQRF